MRGVGLEFVVGGWQLGGLYQHQSGAPLGFGSRIFIGDLKKMGIHLTQVTTIGSMRGDGRIPA